MAEQTPHDPNASAEPGAQGDHAHPEFLAHHFDTPLRQYSSGKLGMWMFLATEILMFGGLFCAYAIYSTNHSEMFKDGHQLLDKKWGAINTIVLLISSFSMAWAVNAAQLSKRKLCVGLLGFTFACGVAFMCIKYVEYNHKFEMGVGPGKFFDEEFVRNDENWLQPDAHVDAVHDESDPDDHAPDPSPQDLALQRVRSTVVPAAIGPTGLAPPRTDDDHGGHGDSEHHYPRLTAAQVIGAKNYFNIYFGMTGLHGIHVLVGMGLILWILRRAARNEFSAAYYTPVDLVGLYWHLVDLIWIFLFPLLYLVT